MKATRRIVPGEVILADYGDQYWAAWPRRILTVAIFREAALTSWDSLSRFTMSQRLVVRRGVSIGSSRQTVDAALL